MIADEKTCLFMMHVIILFFSMSPVHVKRCLPYIIIKDDRGEGL